MGTGDCSRETWSSPSVDAFKLPTNLKYHSRCQYLLITTKWPANKCYLPQQCGRKKNLVSLTLNLEDCKSPEITVEPTKVYFKGTGGPDKKLHEVTIELFNEIDTEESKYSVRDRSIEFFLKKKEEGPYWPSLMKEKKKVHWLKIDFNRWRDEDDSDPEDNGESEDLDENASNGWFERSRWPNGFE